MENKQEVEQRVRWATKEILRLYEARLCRRECIHPGWDSDDACQYCLADQILAISELCIKADDPQAEMVGRFLEMGWTPPAELETKIEEAKKQERERIFEELESFELVTEVKHHKKFIIWNGDYQALKGEK